MYFLRDIWSIYAGVSEERFYSKTVQKVGGILSYGYWSVCIIVAWKRPYEEANQENVIILLTFD